MSKKDRNKFLEQIRSFVQKKYGKDKAVTIMHNAYYRYTELCIENKDEAKAKYIHTRERIYPSIAIFEALITNDISRKDASDLVHLFYALRSAKLANKIKRYMKIPFLYKFAPNILNSFMVKFFNEEAGFVMKKYDTPSNQTHFDMLSCLYCKTLNHYKCPELVEAFCHADVLCFGSMHKKVLFERTKTIANGDDCCDFRIRIK